MAHNARCCVVDEGIEARDPRAVQLGPSSLHFLRHDVAIARVIGLGDGVLGREPDIELFRKLIGAACHTQWGVVL